MSETPTTPEPVDAAPAHQPRVGGIHHGIHLEGRDVAPDDLDLGHLATLGQHPWPQKAQAFARMATKKLEPSSKGLRSQLASPTWRARPDASASATNSPKS